MIDSVTNIISYFTHFPTPGIRIRRPVELYDQNRLSLGSGTRLPATCNRDGM
jgi:hypothetical protein